MEEKKLYTIGQFMNLAHVTKKTLRYYDEHNILKPTYVTEAGARYYSDHDLAKLQQILLLKYLGFSLADIREMTLTSDSEVMESSLVMQKKLIDDKIEQLRVVSRALDETTTALRDKRKVDWSGMLQLIHAMGMEQSLKSQYQNASNISARISLHMKYAANRKGWFPWVFEQCRMRSGMRILELGCGDGSFWMENQDRLPKGMEIVVSDISDGMLRDTKRNLETRQSHEFSYSVCDCEQIPYPDESFDLVIANHVLFYCEHISKAVEEVRRVLRSDGTFICSTYGSKHMKEMSQLVEAFDDRIVLAAEKLYERFGRENGAEILKPCFTQVQWKEYEDHLMVPDVDALISYVMSCHGNQTQYIVDRYKEFRNHVKKYIGNGLFISKDAGVFLCKK